MTKKGEGGGGRGRRLGAKKLKKKKKKKKHLTKTRQERSERTDAVSFENEAEAAADAEADAEAEDITTNRIKRDVIEKKGGIERARSPPYTPRWFDESDVRKKLLFNSGGVKRWTNEGGDFFEHGRRIRGYNGRDDVREDENIRSHGPVRRVFGEFKRFVRDIKKTLCWDSDTDDYTSKRHRKRRYRLLKYGRNGALCCALLLASSFFVYVYFLTRNPTTSSAPFSSFLFRGERENENGGGVSLKGGSKNAGSDVVAVQVGTTAPLLTRANLRFRYDDVQTEDDSMRLKTTVEKTTRRPSFSISSPSSSSAAATVVVSSSSTGHLVANRGGASDEVVSTLMELHVWPHGDDDVVFVESGCGTEIANVLLRKMIELKTQRSLVATTTSFAMAEGLTREFAGLHPSVRIVEADPATLPVHKERFNKGFVVVCGDEAFRKDVVRVFSEMRRVLIPESPVALVVVSDRRDTREKDVEGARENVNDVASFLSDVKRSGLVVVDDIRTDTVPPATVIVAVATRS
eukprot:g1473.t1